MNNSVFSNGFLILDKPEGISSAKAVTEVKKLLQCKKIGHGGTLDPLASGILPLAIGEATKAFDYVASSRKEYWFTVTFGEERATDDREGKVTARADGLPTLEQILGVLPNFTGTILQIPPVYSALKVDGKRAYARARAGELIEMQPREVEIYSLRFTSPSPLAGTCAKASAPYGAHVPTEALAQVGEGREGGAPQAATSPLALPSLTLPRKGGGNMDRAGERNGVSEATFTVTCGKGTYVRSLGRDIARACNSLGYISALRRAAVGRFTEANAISLDNLPGLLHNPALFKAWIPIELALDDIPAIDLEAEQAARLRHGQTLETSRPDGHYMALCQGFIVALAEATGGVLRSRRVFNL